MAVTKTKILASMLSGLIVTIFIGIGIMVVFQQDIYKYLFIEENKNKAFETLTNIQLKIAQDNYYDDYTSLSNCLKRYNEVLYPNIYVSNVLTNRSRITEQYLTIYKTITVQSVYSVLENNIIFNTIKDKICLTYENYTIT